jgi:hypothetical protein
MTRYRFEAAIQRGTGWGAFVIFPLDTTIEFGIKGRVPVRAKLGGIAYAGSLMPFGTGHHKLAVPREISETLGKKPGELLVVELWKDDAPRTVELPENFLALLRKEKLLKGFEALTLTRRKEYRNWITSAKREETRRQRMERAVAMLRAEAGKRKKA